MAKITIEKFLDLKNAIIHKIEVEMEELDTLKDSISPEEHKQQAEEFLTSLLLLQKELLSYDLSDIPFEMWKGMYLYDVNDEGLDFSSTHANLDLNLLADFSCQKFNLNGCYVRGLDRLNYHEKDFDEEFINNHPMYFPDKSVPEDIREAFYKREVKFAYLSSYPQLKSLLNAKCFRNNYDGYDSDLIRILGYSRAMEFFEEYPDFVIFIAENSISLDSIEDKDKLKSASYPETKQILFKHIISRIQKGQLEFPSVEIIPVELKEMFPNLFLSDDIPLDLQNAYYEGNLSLATVRFYQNELQGKSLSFAIRNTKSKLIPIIFGSVEQYLELVPHEIDCIVGEFLHRHDEDNIVKFSQMSSEEKIGVIIRSYLYNNSLQSLSELYACSKFVPLDRLINDDILLEFIQKCGIKRLYDYNQKHNGILDLNPSMMGSIEMSFLSALSQINLSDNQITIDSEESLEEFIFELVQKFREHSLSNHLCKELIRKYRNELSAIYPSEFIDYKVLEEMLHNYDEKKKLAIISDLEQGINGNFDCLLTVLSRYPELIGVLKDAHIILANNSMEKYLYTTLGQDLFLEIISKYGMGIKQLGINDIHNLGKQYPVHGDYEDFLDDLLIKSLSKERRISLKDFPESFKKRHPELFLKDSVPYDLFLEFYGNDLWGEVKVITIRSLANHPEWVEHLMHLDLKSCFKDVKIGVINSSFSQEKQYVQQMNIFDVLLNVFTKEEVLNLLVNYGSLLTDEVLRNLCIDIGASKDDCHKAFMKHIYDTAIVKYKINYDDRMPEEFKKMYPDLFLDKEAFTDEDEYEVLAELFYSRKLDPEILNECPEFLKYLQNKKLSIACWTSIYDFVYNLENLGVANDVIFKLFQKYGEHLERYSIKLTDFKGTAYEEIDKYVLENVIDAIITKRLPYDEDAKRLIGHLHPELFLDENAPEELKTHFYNIDRDAPLTFEFLKTQKDYMQYLKNKNVLLSMLKGTYGIGALSELFNRYGQEEALKIGMRNPESVMKMVTSNKVDLLCQWYDKLHFIPHHIVMMEFPVELSDKFMAAGKKWSQIMRIEGHNLNEEVKAALLKASMCFGVFDNDIDGFNKIMQLFTGVPHVLSSEHYSYITEYIENLSYSDSEDNKIKSNNLMELFSQSYAQNENGDYILRANVQEDKKLANILRTAMQDAGVPIILSPSRSHQLFGGFDMQYDAEFRDFIMSNMDKILDSDEYIAYISAMQKRWQDIKAWNKNRALTLDLALAFVKSNSFTHVEPGNNLAAELVSKEGYSESDWERLEQIYNYGKMRIFSSIPRVEGQNGNYSYELLRLDDPLALVIGRLTDCCQELGNAAEVCMEHSMVSKDGRLFVVRDSDGSIVAQSWVWRNQNVICFDNIEVPDRQMRAHGIPRGQEDSGIQNEFTDEILDIYIKAATEIVIQDNLMYEQLLKAGKITREQYEALKVGKVTVGLGYSNIKGSFVRLQTDNNLIHPAQFTPPVHLSRDLYTNDSEETQYLLHGTSDVVASEETALPLYQDEYIIYDDRNMTSEMHWLLRRLENATKGSSDNTEVYEEENVVTNIAYNCDLNPYETKIIMNANFAIVYAISDGKLIIGDLYYNTGLTLAGTPLDATHYVIMQIRLALEQIGLNNYELNIENLNDHQQQMLKAAINLNEEIEMERGLTGGKR